MKLEIRYSPLVRISRSGSGIPCADMDGLDDREKWLLYLRYVSGYTYVEIARMLALPYEQVKKQGYRAYLKLKRAWEG